MLSAAFLFGASLLSLGSETPRPAEVYKLAIEKDGVYQVAFTDLASTGPALPSRQLSLSVQGREIPIWVEDGGDGEFGPGDRLIFVASHLQGEHSHFNEFSRFNVYWLGLKEHGGLRMQSAVPEIQSTPRAAPDAAPATTTLRLEQDSSRFAFPAATDGHAMETWYMSRLSHLDSKPWSWEVNPFQSGPVRAPVGIRVGLAGLSHDQAARQAGMAQHRVELQLNWQTVASGEWNGQEVFVLDVPATDPAAWLSGPNHIEITVPRRPVAGGNNPVIDVSLLNWIELSYPFTVNAAAGQQAIDAAHAGATVSWAPMAGAMLFSPAGQRLDLNHAPAGLLPLNEAGRWYLVMQGGYLSPVEIHADVPSHLRSVEQQADYLMITQGSLKEPLRKLADFHRQQGLKVALVDVEDIYDEFNHGIPSPYAIRDFIAHAWRHWQGPAPRFVLLAGDADWDINQAPDASRNLVPTLQVQAHDEFAASDNGLVAFGGDQGNGDNWRPRLAIGRIPVVTAAELAGVIGKLLHYADDATPGPWRRNITWVSDNDPTFQGDSNALAQQMELRGYAARRIYPTPDSGADQHALKQALTDGAVLVHFLGHGGRFVWRTGPPDYRDSTDLFNAADVAALPPNRRLPMVLSMTCSSGPFDHPSADSLAETFLRLPDRGAVAVLAASWRIPASRHFSEAVVGELTKPGQTIGEAIMRAKQAEKDRSLVESYNLLGDPALRLAIPALKLALQVKTLGDSLLLNMDQTPQQYPAGKLIIDWLDSAGNRLKTEQHEWAGGSVTLAYPQGSGARRPVAIAVYLWSTDSGQDGMGFVSLPVSAGNSSE